VTEADVPDSSIDAGFARILEGNAPDAIATAHALRAAVEAAMPDIVEQVDFGNGLLAFDRSMAMRDLLFAIIPHKSHVILQLADGADLPDPDGSIEGTGKRIRHVKVRSVEAAASPAVRYAIDAQIAYVR
jgi:hypothetical protein